MRVLITRPEDAARRTAARLEALGHTPVILPLFKAEALPVDIKPGKNYSAFAFTSRNALDALATNSEFAARRSTPVFAVGARTAEAVTKAGFTHVHHAEGGGERLAELIHKANIGNGPLAYFTCEPRSPAFEKRLEAHAIPFEIFLCYRMNPVAYTQEDLSSRLTPQPDIVLLYSRETANRFFTLLETKGAGLAANTRFLCLSKNIMTALPAEFMDRAQAAQAPNEEALFSLL